MSDVGYVDVAYADQYVTEHYVSTDETRQLWTSLSEDDKKVLLRISFEALETLPFVGRKSCPDQETMFPRFPFDYVPQAIMAAQIENALALTNTSTTEEAAFYEKLWQYGVESYSIGNLSESVSSGSWGRGTPAAAGIVSARATRLLQPYLCGSYDIRRPRR